jgi:hypothetical protein
VPLGFVFVGMSPPEMLFGIFAAYAASGPLLWAWRKTRPGGESSAAEAPEDED